MTTKNKTTAAQTTLLHAADLLEADARSWRECCNADPQHPDWKGEPDAQAAHDDALCTALERECGDVYHAIWRLIGAGDISGGAVSRRADDKAKSVMCYLHHQGHNADF